VAKGKRLLAAVAWTMVVCSVAAGGASAHPFADWSGAAGPFRWQAKLISCGDVTGEPNRMEAHSRWINSPANGYQRVIFRRQIWDGTEAAWETVSSQAYSTKNRLGLKGREFILHWTQFFQPVVGEEGKTSRDVVRFVWRRDRSGPDRTVFARRLILGPCIVGS
jgi:hypothetical protein